MEGCLVVCQVWGGGSKVGLGVLSWDHSETEVKASSWGGDSERSAWGWGLESWSRWGMGGGPWALLGGVWDWS